jgi:hypothetical protein
MKWKRFLVSSGQTVSVYEVAKWLDGLIGSNFKDHEGLVISDILSWQIVPEGSYLKAVAMVLVEERE